MNKELRKFVESKLCNDQSPEAIAGRLKYQEKELPYVSKKKKEKVNKLKEMIYCLKCTKH